MVRFLSARLLLIALVLYLHRQKRKDAWPGPGLRYDARRHPFHAASVAVVLPLEDPRWYELAHRNWDGSRTGDPDAPFVPDVLARLYEAPDDAESFANLWPYLCSEGTTYAAAYAAIPHIVRLAATVPRESRAEYLIFVGLALTYSTPDAGESYAVMPYLRADLEQAKQEALALILNALEVAADEQTVRYLLAAAAALLGHARLAEAIQCLDLDQTTGDV